MKLKLVVDVKLWKRARCLAAVLVPILMVAGGATGCTAQYEDPQSGEATPPAPPTEQPDSFCINHFGCPPAPTVLASAYFGTVSFKAGPFNPGDSIVVWDPFLAGTTATAVWTCAPGQTCPSWSYYATGTFYDANWPCGATENVWARDVTTQQPQIESAPTQNVCSQ
jgi:hypothetical protein